MISAIAFTTEIHGNRLARRPGHNEGCAAAMSEYPRWKQRRRSPSSVWVREGEPGVIHANYLYAANFQKSSITD